jgi:K+-transporting ATPase KdpF subunit
VDWTTILALVVAVALAIYLTAALLAPEKFS